MKGRGGIEKKQIKEKKIRKKKISEKTKYNYGKKILYFSNNL